MKPFSLFLLLFQLFFVFAQKEKDSPWHIVANTIDPNNYYGITVANGMVGMVSSPEPLKIKDVVLNGVFGLGGLDIQSDGVKQLPVKLPKAWKSLTLKGIGKEETTFTVN